LTDALTTSADPFSSSLAGRRLGRYEVLARLASGGMAGVYVARALGVAGFERMVAVKVLHPHLAHEQEFISMFLDEARLAARIRHPNVVPTIDISDTPDAGFYLVMDYIEGDHLGALLQRAWKLGTRMPWPVTLRVIVDALEGLAAAHNLTDETGRRLNLVHRDVSPHNIMVSTDGIARLTDFGVAKAEVRLSTTREGQFKGKLAYMAPEHASSGDADQRSDLFSMAIILWECLTGSRLFRAENHAATLNKICLEPIPLPSSIDPQLEPFDAVLAKGLARDPEQRYQSAEEFAEAIEHTAHNWVGMAKQREVAQIVREYAAEKIAHDADLIRTATAQLANEAAMVPMDPPPPPPRATLANAAPAVQPAPPPPIDMPPVQIDVTDLAEGDAAAQPSRRGLWIGLVLLLAAGGIGAFIALSKNAPEEVETVPLAGANETPTPAPSAAPAPTPTTPVVPANGAPAEAPSAVVPAPAVPTNSVEAKPEPVTAEPPRAATSDEPTEAELRRREARQERRAKESSAVPAKPSKPASSDDDLMLNPYRN
jgi:eukaryotic-like serine/threonine-protein kinase